MRVSNYFYFLIGLIFLGLAKTKNILKGYTPKPFSISGIDKCINYDINVVNHWLSYLDKYTGKSVILEGKSILELGPGSDLGAGIYLLCLGAEKYNAIDVYNLEKNTPSLLYERLFDKLKELGISETRILKVREELYKFKAGKMSRLNYVVRKDFDIISAFDNESIDLVFSQAVFEHLENVEKTIFQLSKVCKSGAILISEIDLQTHSRWIRDKDPNNIYRYPEWLYKMFWFKGIPNRVRPYQYKSILESYGWGNILIIPLKTFDRSLAYSGIHPKFSDNINQMECLSIMLCAKKR